MVFRLDIMLYVVTGLYGFLIIVLFAFIIHLYQTVQNLSKDDNKSDISSPQEHQPDLPSPKPVKPQSRPHNNYDLPEQNYDRNDSPERNHGHSSLPERNYGQSNFRGDKDFGGIDFNNRMAVDKPFKPSSSQGGPYRNPLFDQGPSTPEKKYDFADSRDKQPKPFTPGFRLPNVGYNQSNKNPNHLYPKREYQNNNFRY